MALRSEPWNEYMETIFKAVFPQDIRIIRILWNAYCNHLKNIQCWDLGGETVDPELAALAQCYPEEDGGIYLAREHETVQGTIALNRINADTGEARRLFVYPEFRGQGVGKKLMVFAIEEARRLGYKTLLLDTFRSEPGPQALYKSLGFRERSPYNHYPADRVMFFEIKL